MEAIIINKHDLDVLFNSIPRIAKQTSDEQIKELVRRFSRGALANTPPLLPSREAGSSKMRRWEGTRREHTAFLRGRILGMRLPRGYLGRNSRDKHMSKAEAQAYFAEARRRQGELLSGWLAGAEWSGAKFPQWIRRHGKSHGALSWSSGWANSTARIGFVDNSKNRATNIRRFAERAKDRALYGLQKEAEKLLEKKLAKELAKQGVKP